MDTERIDHPGETASFLWLRRGEAEAAPPAEGPVPVLDRLGDYRLVRELGRGGMGLVYEAEQEALGRRVAIKVLPPNLLANEKVRERFRREALAAARLHHTNIVPVFGVGEQDGYCYYVMQLIAGRGLDDVLADAVRLRADPAATSYPGPHRGRLLAGSAGASGASPPDPASALAHQVTNSSEYARAMARVALQVAEALAYAHAQGVLHRDIKPSNLLLDERGTVWITDFGVAKLTSLPGEANGNLTGRGELLGTLKYMPPERLRGVSDARGDVYSLGITLYEMLALRPPFPEADPSNLLQFITHGEMRSPRRFVSGLPRDLETIVLKAAARDPAHRYQTAGELADDLRRFLDDQPIRARRTTAVQHLWRWARRNPLAGSLAVAALTLLALIALVSATAYLRTAAAHREVEAANDEMEIALAAEQRQREHAEATSALALEALNRIYNRFAPNRITVTSRFPVGGADEEQIEVRIEPALSREAGPLLEEMLVFYERLAKQGGDYAALRPQAAEANHRIGDVRQRLGQFEQAATAYQRAIQLHRELCEASPGEVAARMSLARSCNELGRVHRAVQRRQEEQATHAEALKTLLESARGGEVLTAYRYELARTYYFVARAQTTPFGPPPGPPPGRRPGGKDAAARPESQPIQEALRLLDELVKEHPSVPDYRHLLACCYRDVPLERFARTPTALRASVDKAVQILRQLAKEFPDVPDYRYDLVETYAKVDPRPFFGPEFAAFSQQRLQQALTISRGLVTDYPNVSHYAALHAQVYHKLGLVLHQMKQFEESEKMLREAVGLQTVLLRRFPEVGGNSFLLTLMQSSLGRVLIDRKRWVEAREILEAGIARQTELRQKVSRPVFLAGPLAANYGSLAQVLTHLGEADRAAEALRKSEQVRAEAFPKPPAPPRSRAGDRR